MGKERTTTPRSPRAESVAPRGEAPLPAAVGDSTYEAYVVEGEQGRGGLGRVLRAHDTRLGRPVAIKELLVQDADAEARFLREAMLTAQLQHPSIVPVYELGHRADGSPFYAMKLIEGESLEALIAATKTLDDRLALLPNVLAVAEAIAYAHDRRIIHRDLKPSNIVVGAFGETMVIDWGLAKLLSEDDAGGVMGTLAYMAPEQLTGASVDERADVFALGACLYHTVTGAAPYAGSSVRELAQKVARAEPTPIEAREPGAPPELVAIVKQAMHVDARQRYANAKELANDLKRFETGQLVSAHHYSRAVLARRWLVRHKRGVAVTAAVAIAFASFGAFSVRRIVREKARAEEQGAIAREERARAEARAEQLTLVEAKTSLDRDPTAAIAWLKTYPPSGAAQRTLATIAADAERRGVARHVLRGHAGAVSVLAIAPDNRTLASGGDGSTVRLWDLETGKPGFVFAVGTHVSMLDFTPDGATVIAPGSDGAIYALDVASGKSRRFAGHASKARLAAISRDGKSLVSTSEDRSVRVFSIESGESRVLGEHAAAAEDVALAPDGEHAATIGGDAVRVWSLAGGAPRVLPVTPGEMAARIAWSPDGRRIAAIEPVGGTIRIFDTVRWTSSVLRGHEGALQAMIFSPDGARLASCGRDSTVRVWDLEHGGSRVFRGHVDVVEDVTWAPDGKRVISSGEDGTVRVWDLATGDATVLRGHEPIAQAIAVSSDGRFIVSGGADHSIRVWSGSEDAQLALRGHDHDVFSIAYAPDGATIASGAQDDRIVLWNLASGASQVLTGHDDVVAEVAFARGGRALVSASWDHTVRLWDLATHSSRAFFHDNTVTGLAIGAGGEVAVSSSVDGTAHVIELATGEVRVLRGHTGGVRAVAITGDGSLVATAGNDATARLWDRATGAERAVLRGHGDVVSNVAFSPDGKLLATTSWDTTVRLWDTARFTEVAVLRGHTERVRPIAFSPDGARLATGSNDATVRLWDVAARAPIAVCPHDQLIRDLAFSPDGALLASTSNDRTRRLWDASAVALGALRCAGAAVTTVAWAPDGAHVAVAGWDRTVRVWPVAGLIPAAPEAVRAWLDTLTSATVDPAIGEVTTR